MIRTGLAALAALACCASASAQNIDAKPPVDYARIRTMALPVIKEDITDHPYRVIATVEATASKLTRFSKNPTNQLLAEKLWEKAKPLGADAVLNAQFGAVEESGWTYARRQATGDAVHFLTDDEIAQLAH